MIEIKTGKIDFIVKSDYDSIVGELNKPEKFISITYYYMVSDKNHATWYEKKACLHKDEIEFVEPSIIYEWDKIKGSLFIPE